MSSNPSENRMISRINGHLREADELSDELRRTQKIEPPVQFFLQKAEVKAQVGLLYEAQRANDIAELQALLAFWNDGPNAFFDDASNKPLVKSMEKRMVELVDGMV